MKFKPCIDLRKGKVVQIVGGTLKGSTENDEAVTNFESKDSPSEFATRYRSDHLAGGHVISLGAGNQDAAKQALSAFQNGMQYGGGVNSENAASYIEAGASHVIVTSYVFRDGIIDYGRIDEMLRAVGKENLVLDLSCRRRDGEFFVVTDRWQKFTEVQVNASTINELAAYCDEFLVHGVDVEGLQAGIDEELVVMLGNHSPIPTTYAGGAKTLADLDRVEKLGQGKVDLTIGSALDIFGGETLYTDVVAWHRQRNPV